MISLNDYLYQGDTVLKILNNYEKALRSMDSKDAMVKRIDGFHAEYLKGIIDILEHNDFLTSQSQRIREFYLYMVKQYPYLSFTFKGRIKSLIRAEEKFNRHLIELTDDVLAENQEVQNLPSLLSREKILDIRDIIAYRIIISVPKCHVQKGKTAQEMEREALYDIANVLPAFMSDNDFVPEISEYAKEYPSNHICDRWRSYYKDFVEHIRETGYQSLHIVFCDKVAKCRFEMQLRTKEMDDYAEIGTANHTSYEERQKKSKNLRPESDKMLPFYEEAYERLALLQELDLSKVDVNMFAAKDNVLMNDGCGLYRGRLILPYEHLSRFQNDQIV
ncbi:MAG: guanosine polyphosphate pyrophosphohydrolase [Eubacteriales bacterium]|nr:guanosine polyphosphate pyrophosphohydrolase [Eubacteriales bacterium]